MNDPDLQIRSTSAHVIGESWSGISEAGWDGVIDGAPFTVERGVEGDHRFVHGAQPDRSGAPSRRTRAIHHLSADARVLRCAPSDPTDVSWWRVVLDSVLFTVALIQGFEALHAAALATPDGAIAITAPAGGGKSTLLAELLGRGYALMADDVLVLDSRVAGPAFAHPAPPLMTVPETRVVQLDEAAFPQTISKLDGERWIAVPVWPEPLPMKAIVVLDRRSGSQGSGSRASLARIENPLAPLLDSLMSFPKTLERERARFELASVLANKTGLWRLTASLDTPASALADALLAADL